MPLACVRRLAQLAVARYGVVHCQLLLSPLASRLSIAPHGRDPMPVAIFLPIAQDLQLLHVLVGVGSACALYSYRANGVGGVVAKRHIEGVL